MLMGYFYRDSILLMLFITLCMYYRDEYAVAVTNVQLQEAARAAVPNVLPPRRAEKEDMTDFIAKKREMFLVQMSLDTKHEEVSH
jgi:hypothetical protein